MELFIAKSRDYSTLQDWNRRGNKRPAAGAPSALDVRRRVRSRSANPLLLLGSLQVGQKPSHLAILERLAELLN